MMVKYVYNNSNNKYYTRERDATTTLLCIWNKVRILRLTILGSYLTGQLNWRSSNERFFLLWNKLLVQLLAYDFDIYEPKQTGDISYGSIVLFIPTWYVFTHSFNENHRYLSKTMTNRWNDTHFARDKISFKFIRIF